MWAHDGSIRMCSPLESNNQRGGEDASQTSGNVANNGHCGLGAVVSLYELQQVLLPLSLLIMHQLANHAQQCLMKVFHLPIALSMVGCGPALLDAKGSTKFLHQGRCEVHTPISQ